MSIYADLLEFKRGLLSRVNRDIANLRPPAQKAVAADLEFVEAQMHGYQERLDLWYRHKGRELALTKREFQLLQFLLDHPHR